MYKLLVQVQNNHTPPDPGVRSLNARNWPCFRRRRGPRPVLRSDDGDPTMLSDCPKHPKFTARRLRIEEAVPCSCSRRGVYFQAATLSVVVSQSAANFNGATLQLSQTPNPQNPNLLSALRP